MAYLTTDLGMQLADPLTVQAFETAQVNANFEILETAILDGQTVQAGYTTALATVNSNEVRSGTTAARNTFWGSPATEAERSALNNKGARWYNIDRGWEERYFASSSDAGVAGQKLTSSAAAGWYPISGGLPSITMSRVDDQGVAGTKSFGQVYGPTPNYQRGGTGPLLWTYSAPDGYIKILLAGDYEVSAQVSCPSGSGTISHHIGLNGTASTVGTSLAMDTVSLKSAPVMPGLQVARRRFAVNDVIRHLSALGTYTVAVGGTGDDARFEVRYLGPPLTSVS